MKYFIGEHQIKYLCSFHGVQFGVQKAPNKPNYKTGICDVCEWSTDQKNAPQSVLPVADYQGLMVNDSNGLIEIRK